MIDPNAYFVVVETDEGDAGHIVVAGTDYPFISLHVYRKYSTIDHSELEEAAEDWESEEWEYASWAQKLHLRGEVLYSFVGPSCEEQEAIEQKMHEAIEQKMHEAYGRGARIQVRRME